MAARGFKTYPISLPKRGMVQKIPASSAVITAVKEILGELTLHQVGKMSQFVEAAYELGRKDGAHEVIEAFDRVKAAIPYQKPGRPKNKKALTTKVKSRHNSTRKKAS